MLAALASSTISHKDRFTQAIRELHCSTSLQQISSVSAYINEGIVTRSGRASGVRIPLCGLG